MNQRLEKEWKSYCEKQCTGTMISVNVKDVAQHFYNLALEEMMKDAVRAEIKKCRWKMPVFLPVFFTSEWGEIGDKVKIIILKDNEAGD